MKRILALALAPLVVAFFVGHASAQDDRGTPRSSDDEVGSSVDTGTTAATGGAANFGAVISAIQQNGQVADDIATISDASQVQVIRVSDIAAEESVPALDNALAQHADGVESLHAAVEANTVLSERLQEEQIAIEDVVAAAAADGMLVLYVR